MQIDKGSISLSAAAAIIMATFTVAGWAAFVESRFHELEEHRSESKALLEAICTKLECDKNGMRRR